MPDQGKVNPAKNIKAFSRTNSFVKEAPISANEFLCDEELAFQPTEKKLPVTHIVKK